MKRLDLAGNASDKELWQDLDLMVSGLVSQVPLVSEAKQMYQKSACVSSRGVEYCTIQTILRVWYNG